MVIKEDAIVCKDLIPQNIWCNGYRVGDETQADIIFSGGNGAVGQTSIIIGRQSATGNAGTGAIIMRGRTSSQGLYINPGAATLKIDTTGAPSNAAYGILELNSITKNLIVARMTTAQLGPLSGANYSGSVAFNVTTRKLMVCSGAGWETITSV